MIIISKYMVPKGYTGIAVFPFVFLKHPDLKLNVVLINHEKIHLRQQIELLIIPFYLFYCIEFFCKLLKYRDWMQAYRNISFEREAYTNQTDFNYLKNRSFWGFLNFMRLK